MGFQRVSKSAFAWIYSYAVFILSSISNAYVKKDVSTTLILSVIYCFRIDQVIIKTIAYFNDRIVYFMYCVTLLRKNNVCYESQCRHTHLIVAVM